MELFRKRFCTLDSCGPSCGSHTCHPDSCSCCLPPADTPISVIPDRHPSSVMRSPPSITLVPAATTSPPPGQQADTDLPGQTCSLGVFPHPSLILTPFSVILLKSSSSLFLCLSTSQDPPSEIQPHTYMDAGHSISAARLCAEKRRPWEERLAGERADFFIFLSPLVSIFHYGKVHRMQNLPFESARSGSHPHYCSAITTV